MFYVEEENKEAKQGYSKEKIPVYAVRTVEYPNYEIYEERWSTKEKTEFLIFHYNYWEWVDSSNFVPA